MGTTHISVEDALTEFPRLIARARAGEEVCIDEGAETVAIMQAPQMLRAPRLLSEVLAGLDSPHVGPPSDPSFMSDVEDAVRGHEHERLIDPWESF
ncbi:MAG TPA: hypothetical protein VN612_01295 [Acidobacteriaceae bacterium]|nr:hypothetical protein [Acidobacteriaceae bacterium]